jgi:pyrimidine-nucleoside phosphorylase
MVELLRKKRDGKVLTREELESFVNGFISGSIPDYQVSAFLMAVYFKGMTDEETAVFTEVMMKSGDVVDLSSIDGIKVDKHSTGGVGDKTTLILAPLVAAAGVNVAKMSGRGLGHTGGTLDKLESIPGLIVNLSQDQFINQVRDIGVAICGQNNTLVPADKKLYALRDVTATVNNFALIASSILSKKFACGADAIVIDIKVGAGAYMATTAEAESLALLMKSIASKMNRELVVVISAMEEPLGNKIGNSLEIEEVIDTLKGNGPQDLTDLVITLGSHMLVLAKRTKTNEEGARLLKKLLDGGDGLRRFEEMIASQGGDIQVINDFSKMEKSSNSELILSPESGFISGLNALSIGKACVVLGAGRRTKDSEIDHSAGIELLKKTGAKISKGEPIAKLYFNDASKMEEAKSMVTEAFTFSNDLVNPMPLIIKEIYK